MGIAQGQLSTAANGTIVWVATTMVATDTNQGAAMHTLKLIAQGRLSTAANGARLIGNAFTMEVTTEAKTIAGLASKLSALRLMAANGTIITAATTTVATDPNQTIPRLRQYGLATIPRPRQQGPSKWILRRNKCSGGAKIRSFVSGKYTSSTEDGASRSMETGRASTGMKKASGVNGATNDLEDLVHSGGTATPIKDVPAGMLSKVIRTTTLQ